MTHNFLVSLVNVTRYVCAELSDIQMYFLFVYVDSLINVIQEINLKVMEQVDLLKVIFPHRSS